ncbi:unnamed protein product [Pylaiella littoralis]
MSVPIWGLAKGQSIFKVNARVMQKLMPTIKEVKCVMNPLDGGHSTAAKDVLRRLQSGVLKKASPDTKVVGVYKYESCWPMVEATYADGTVRKWWAHVLPSHTLLSEVFMYAQMAYNNPDNPANKSK